MTAAARLAKLEEQLAGLGQGDEQEKLAAALRGAGYQAGAGVTLDVAVFDGPAASDFAVQLYADAAPFVLVRWAPGLESKLANLATFAHVPVCIRRGAEVRRWSPPLAPPSKAHRGLSRGRWNAEQRKCP